MTLPKGFFAGATKAGIKPSGKTDLALLVSNSECTWAYSGTTNRAAAPCVTRNRVLLESDQPLQAIVVNAGNANCATGQVGIEANERMAAVTATKLGIKPAQVATASTGVIGVPLPVEKIEIGLPKIELAGELEPFAVGIMTTDLVPKTATITLSSGAKIVGVCKGSGMIAPNMATMLAYLVSDAAVAQSELRRHWQGIVERSFNQVTVDTDTSTNDMALLLCNAQAGKVDYNEFWHGVEKVCVSLAKQLARDGEGATKLLTVEVVGARNDSEARAAALSVAASPLWKSAVYGNDPNWGRIMMAIGKSNAFFETTSVQIAVQGVVLFDGAVQNFDKAAVSRAMNAAEVLTRVDLRQGEGSGWAWGCDLTEGYVKINAEYTT
ncbi:MAG: bifunctional glutamate N-acetyltransferase/amino-acid acetyltransferase ArgJ [Deinococcales bacterium]